MSNQKGWQLAAYLFTRRVLQPIMPLILSHRLRSGKEDPTRILEKLGHPTQSRPTGRVVWVHAVGLGEVLAVRPLITQMQAAAPDLSFIITSTARSSAIVLANNLPERCIHQFLPLDGPTFVRKFLDYWKPDLAIWSEQDLWPGTIHDCAARQIPLAYVNARMNNESHRRKAWFSGLYRDTYARFAIVAAQDAITACNLRHMGVPAPILTGSLKPAAAPLAVDQLALTQIHTDLAERKIWVAASTHAADEAVIFAAQKILQAQNASWLVIIAPRLPQRRAEIETAMQNAGLTYATRSKCEQPIATQPIWLADSFGELGLWFRLANSAFIGGSFGGIGGHNPWEAISLARAVHHGPDTQNFKSDYAQLSDFKLSTLILDTENCAEDLAQAVQHASTLDKTAIAIVKQAQEALKPLATNLINLIKATK